MFEKYIENDLIIYYNTIQHSKLKEIIKYSLEGGKAIRGGIIKHIIETLSGKEDGTSTLWQPIVSIELIHGLSLVLDDLPCMDNDNIRRNKPSTFARFGERHAILVSMFGITEAFKLLFNGIKELDINNDVYIKYIENIINEWNELIGKNLIVGQLMDFKENIGELLNLDIPTTHNRSIDLIYYKTSSLFIFSFILGAIYSNNTNCSNNIDDFKKMGEYLGLMYQIMDDSNDVDTDEVHKNIVLSYGNEKSLQLYRDAESKFIELLLKYNLMTSTFEKLISKLNQKLKF
jgi:geranylgeranyl diphosphate synthase type II